VVIGAFLGGRIRRGPDRYRAGGRARASSGDDTLAFDGVECARQDRVPSVRHRTDSNAHWPQLDGMRILPSLPPASHAAQGLIHGSRWPPQAHADMAIRQPPEAAVTAGSLPRPRPDRAAVDRLHDAYRRLGGMADRRDLVRWMVDCGAGDAATLAGLLADRRVFGFAAGAHDWLPMFQFDLTDLSTRPAPASVAAALGDAFDGWRLAQWFALPHPGLDGRRPVDLLQGDPLRVIAVAAGDRCGSGQPGVTTSVPFMSS
jgi:hypothetical protein